MWFAPEHRSGRRWIVPGLALATGVALAVALTLQGRTGAGLAALAVLAGYAGQLAYRRNEPALPLSPAFGSGHRARVHLRAAAFTGDVTAAALVGAVVVQALRDGEWLPYLWPAALAGVVYTLSAMIAGRIM
ncbi:ABC transporter permease [Thermomonospora catenispora]|uniref:ABC transporter permease n=1 Tax=Thermomonospora catenispora TaxID=2493090 RepID=UPI00111F29F4|nr:ABC transporter permease [Thermomonospora catenispora]TNY37382.1 ABC transporter permease [Thermomonospora catenispora]